MNHAKFKLRQNSRGLIFNKRQVDIVSSIASITQLKSFKSKLLAYYKRFYKLRDFECSQRLYRSQEHPYDKVEISKDDYVNLLKRQFRNVSYNVKRRKFLELPPLSEKEQEQRLANTLAFVFNHTVEKSNSDNNPDEVVVNIEDEERISLDTIESKIISTILRMDKDCPLEIKHDYKFVWLDKLNKRIQCNQLDKNDIIYFNQKSYLTTLMRFNESIKLSL
ncbi:hypothetical protein KGF56_004713 [Candida oxycetoniae]|uniref:Uncharacterized protein n=1 Tax=Candida oxycetoniae TaxID=497107 RepID=A0AAI9STP9_9ASCO|nr:uncharacterized protein KGF56_004713 [Candida oxycetoniae]KAI3402472.2 hypothetical protein KGF56_004713 [Candida oxycetoniae]